MLTTENRISLLYPNYKFVKLNLKSKFNYQTEIKHQTYLNSLGRKDGYVEDIGF